jgi:hypothetical protein
MDLELLAEQQNLVGLAWRSLQCDHLERYADCAAISFITPRAQSETCVSCFLSLNPGARGKFQPTKCIYVTSVAAATVAKSIDRMAFSSVL